MTGEHSVKPYMVGKYLHEMYLWTFDQKMLIHCAFCTNKPKKKKQFVVIDIVLSGYLFIGIISY